MQHLTWEKVFLGQCASHDIVITLCAVPGAWKGAPRKLKLEGFKRD